MEKQKALIKQSLKNGGMFLRISRDYETGGQGGSNYDYIMIIIIFVQHPAALPQVYIITVF